MSNFAHANKGTTYKVSYYLATNILGYGVMVTLQILVLSFLVRVRVSQLSSAQKSNIFIFNIGIWCNGNTTDSGPVILGSSPSIPTKQSLFITNRLFSYIYLSIHTPAKRRIKIILEKQTRVSRTRQMLLMSSYIRVCPKYPCYVIIL